MHGIWRRLFVWIVALAFVTSGASWRQCITASQVHAAMVNTPSTPDHSTHVSLHQQPAGHNHHHTAVDNTQQPLDDHACLKCCSICTTATVMPIAADGMVVFTISSIVYFSSTDDSSGRVVLVDPGIPKRLV